MGTLARELVVELVGRLVELDVENALAVNYYSAVEKDIELDSDVAVKDIESHIEVAKLIRIVAVGFLIDLTDLLAFLFAPEVSSILFHKLRLYH